MRPTLLVRFAALFCSLAVCALGASAQTPGKLYDPEPLNDRVFSHLLGVHPYSISNALECSHDGEYLFSGEGGALTFLEVPSAPVSPPTDFDELKRVQIGEFGVRPARLLLDCDATVDNQSIDGPIPRMVAEALSALRRNMKRRSIVVGLGREDRWDYPEEAIREVGTGEAVTSMLEEKGAPGIVERTLIRPPSSKLGPITAAERAALIATSPIAGKYDTAVDRESAHEILARRAAEAAAEAEAAERAEEEADAALREYRTARRYRGTRVGRSSSRGRGEETLGEAVASVVIKELKGTTGKRIVRGILGGLFKGR